MDFDTPEDSMRGVHEDSQRTTSDGSSNIAQAHKPGAINPAIYTEIHAIVASGSSMFPSAYFDPDTHTFLGDWQGQEAVYMAWVANAENNPQESNGIAVRFVSLCFRRGRPGRAL
jgi:hypothetical protein